MPLNLLPKGFHPDFLNQRKKPTEDVELDSSHDRAKDVVAYYPIISQSNALVDYSGNNRHATPTGSPDHVIDSIFESRAADFGTFSNNYYYTATIPDLSTFTVIATIRAQGVLNNKAIVSLVAGDNQRVTMAIDGSPDDVGVWDNVNSWLRSGQAYEQDLGVQVAIVYNGTTDRKIYYNGILRATDSSVSTIVTGKNTIYIGVEDASLIEKFDGTMRDVKLFSAALSDDEILDHFRDPYQLLRPVNPISYFTSDAAGDITGSGTPTAQDSVAASVGEVFTQGTGAATAADSTVASVGETFTQGTGAALATDSAVSATGITLVDGTGTATADDSTVSAVGETIIPGTGSATAQDSVVNATAENIVPGTGTATAQDSTVAAAGDVVGLATGTGSAVAQDSSVSAAGIELQTGTGAAVAQDSVVAGAGNVVGIIGGTGGAVASDSVVSSVGDVISIGTGSAVANDSSVAAIGDIIIPGTGTATADDSTVASSGNLLQPTGTGSATADNSTVSSVGQVLIIGSGAAAANDSTVFGSDTGITIGTGAATSDDSSVLATGTGVSIGTASPVADDSVVNAIGKVTFITVRPKMTKGFTSKINKGNSSTVLGELA